MPEWVRAWIREELKTWAFVGVCFLALLSIGWL